MASCDHLAWLQVIGVNDIRLLDPGHMYRLIRELRDPTTQKPSTLLFLGKYTKNLALREIFPRNNFKKGLCDGVATLRSDNTSTYSDKPILFAESDPGQAIPLAADRYTSGTESFPIQWTEGTSAGQLYNILHARLFCLFADIICIFADDFIDFDQVIQLLVSWTAAGSANTQFSEVRPRVVVVRRGDEPSPSSTYDILKIEDLQHGLHCEALRKCFSSIKVFHLPARQLSPLARFRRLKELLWREIDEMRVIRESLGCLYSAEHTASFFHLAVAHTAATLDRPFNFVLESRIGNEVQPDLGRHLSRFWKFGKSNNKSRNSIATYVASAILLDAYPPKMHDFNPDIVYDVHYRKVCLQALKEAYKDQDLIQQLNSSEHTVESKDKNAAQLKGALIRGQFNSYVRNQFVDFFSDMKASGKNAAQIHQETMQSLDVEIVSNLTCVFCVAQTPENPLSCGHSMCDVCVRRFGKETWSFDCQYQIDACNLCRNGKLIVGLKPPTAGMRILSIDGGGIRGVIAVSILRLLQDIVGEAWRIQDLFDIAYGTSVGGLIVLILFLRQLPAIEFVNLFDTLAKQLFPRTFSKSARFFLFLRSWYRDGYYDANVLEDCLKRILGISTPLFGPICSITTTKVGVTLATIGKGHTLLLTNYNGPGSKYGNSGYQHIRPNDNELEPYTWEAGRATSAAPTLYPPAYIHATGHVQDGGMTKHNNPIKLALWESKRIDHSEPDIVVSVGTGTTNAPASLKATSLRRVLDHFVPRLWRNYMFSFDGESNFEDVINSLPEGKRDNYKRLNVSLPENEPRIDDTSRLEELKNIVLLDRSLLRNSQETIYALIIASFYFELDHKPMAREGTRIRCFGRIRCRLSGEAMIKVLEHIQISRLTFVTSSGMLGVYKGKGDLCPLCQRYRKQVEFSVLDLNDIISIYVLSPGKPKRNISSFPQSIQWFIGRQGLDAPFGTTFPEDINDHSCDSCATKSSHLSLKRKVIHKEVAPPKRPRPY